MPEISQVSKMLQTLTKLAFILIILQLLASVRAGVIKKREIILTSTVTPTQPEFVDAKVGIGTKLPTESVVLNQLVEATTPKVDRNWNEVTVLPKAKNLYANSRVKLDKNQLAIARTSLKLETITEGGNKLDSDLKIVQKESINGPESVPSKESEVKDHLDFREENYTEHVDDLTNLLPEFSTTIRTDFNQNSQLNPKINLSKSLNQTSKLNLPRVKPENENIFDDGLRTTTAQIPENKTTTATDNLAPTTTTTADDMQLPELIMTTFSPNTAENLAITIQKLKELAHIKNSTHITPEKQSEVSNEITAPTIRTGSEKKAKFINDNSTNQLNLLNTSEVRTLLAMKTIPAKPVTSTVPEDKTQQVRLSTERNKNISGITSSNSEKNLLDWTQIMINENLSNTNIDNPQIISGADRTENVDQVNKGKPFLKFTQAETTIMTPVDVNSTATDVIENDITTTVNNVDEINLDTTDFIPTLATATTTSSPTTTDLNAGLVVTAATTSISSLNDSNNTTNMPSTSVESKTTYSPPTSEQSSNLDTQPGLVDATTFANVNTDSIISTEFLSTTTKPTSFPPTTSVATTMLSPSFPHDNENKAISSDKNSQSKTENTASSEATTQLSSDLTSPAQETSDIIMENTTNTAKTTQAPAIKSVLDTPKNLSTTIIEATAATTMATTEKHLSSTRQPLPENNLITNLNSPPPPANSNDNNYEVTVKINHHNNESDDERANAQVVGEEATLELSTSSGTIVSSTEASAVSTTALAESDGSEVETTTSATTTTTIKTTTATIELTTTMPSISVRENITSNSTAYINQRVNDVDLDASITTTTERFPTTSSTLETILKVDIGEKNTTTSFEEDFSKATTPPTLGGVLKKTTTESLSNFLETTTPASITTTVYENTAVFQNHTIHSDSKEAPKQFPKNSIDMNLIDESENSEKLKQNTANNLNTLAVSEAVDDVELASTTPPTIGPLSTTTERLLISLLDDNTPSTITSSPSTSNEVYEVVATTETPTNPTTGTTTTAINEPTESTVSSVPELKKIAATSIPTTMLPITLETVNSAGIGGPHLQPDSIDPPEMDVNVIIAISISVIGIIALILLVAFLYVVRKRQKQMSYGHRCRPVSLDAYSMDNVSVYNSVRRKGAMRSSKRSYGNVAFDDPSLTHNILNASELSKFVERRSALFDEFKYVPQIIARPDEVPAGCEDKNRYANVIPIPETRVSLQRQNDDEKSEYINANYVRGPRDSPNYYIACQAPLESTVADFWRMIWEQKSRVIIQATDLVENGIEKCAEYLPPSVTLDNHTTYSDFQVTLKHREVKDKYAISTLILKNTLVNSSRELTHYWYKWPETGVPNEEAPIIAMLLEARCSLKSYAVEEANNLKATMISKSDTISTLKQSDKETSSTSSQDNHSVNRTEIDNTTQSNADIDANSSNDKIGRSAANSQGPLTVHCSPGTGRTGTIIGCDIAIRSLETPKRNVDIPQIVYYVRRGRASAVQTKEQYEFIYKIANMYASKITNVSNET